MLVGPALTSNGGSDAFVAKVAPTGTPASSPLVAALLPGSRSVQVGATANALVTILNTGAEPATNVGIALTEHLPGPLAFAYQATDPVTNLPTGTLNTPVTIPAGQGQTFVIGITPTMPFPPTIVGFSFAGTNTLPAPINEVVNTLLLSALTTPVPDIVALAATCPSDDGIPLTLNVPGDTGISAFAVATVNVGVAGSITVTADRGVANLLQATLILCQTNPTTGECITTPGSGGVTVTIAAGATPTFAVFARGTGNIPFDPATNRIFVRFTDASNVVRGATSVAVRTHTPACAP